MSSHEESEINLRAIVTFVVVLTVIALSVNVAMYALQSARHDRDRSQPAVAPLR
jgi:hypothetical protein